MGEHAFKIVQDGIEVVKVSATNREQAVREILHYRLLYSQDGPCAVYEKSGRSWVSVDPRPRP